MVRLRPNTGTPASLSLRVQNISPRQHQILSSQYPSSFASYVLDGWSTLQPGSIVSVRYRSTREYFSGKVVLFYWKPAAFGLRTELLDIATLHPQVILKSHHHL